MHGARAAGLGNEMKYAATAHISLEMVQKLAAAKLEATQLAGASALKTALGHVEAMHSETRHQLSAATKRTDDAVAHVEEFRAQHEATLTAVRREHETQVNDSQCTHEAALQKQANEHAAMQEAAASTAAQVDELQAQHDAAVADIRREHEAQVAALQLSLIHI